MPGKSWLVAIGAGAEQSGAIERAKARGLPVLALDGNPAAPGLAQADEGLVVDIADIAAVLTALESRALAGVLPAPIGRHLRTVGAVNDHFGLRGISEQAAERCTDKVLFHQTLLDAGQTRPVQHSVKGTEALQRAIGEVGLPCVFKPRFGSGSRGVLMLRTDEEVCAALAEYGAWVGEEEPAVVEGVLQGREFGVDGVIVDGQFHPLLLRAKTMTAAPYRQEMVYLSPAPVPLLCRERIVAAVDAAARALGLNHCALNADVMLDAEDKASIIELAGRPPGLLIADLIMPEALSMDFYDALIDFVLSGRFALPTARERAVAFGFLPLRAGRVAQLPSSVSPSMTCRLPTLYTNLGPLRSGADALARGWAMVAADSTSQALATLHAGLDQLTQEICIDDN